MRNPAGNTRNDLSDVLAALSSLYSAVVCDVLDGLGFRQQALSSRVRPLTRARRVYGRVFTARAVAVTETPREPYKLQLAAVDALTRGDVLVVDGQETQTCAFWGELLTTACAHKGVHGVVMTACTRDMWRIDELDFPIFGIGCHPADDKGRLEVVEMGGPITLAGVRTNPGDLIIGDVDGVVIIPGEVAPEAIRRAREKVTGENQVRNALASGMPIGEAFRKFGIL
ncbi:MAG: RraA family protein [Verrucomicrobia bacterium]|nr:RraA family protein [Verrucomicrobiota bacterium]